MRLRSPLPPWSRYPCPDLVLRPDPPHANHALPRIRNTLPVSQWSRWMRVRSPLTALSATWPSRTPTAYRCIASTPFSAETISTPPCPSSPTVLISSRHYKIAISGDRPTLLAFSPDGNYLLVALEESRSFTAYKIFSAVRMSIGLYPVHPPSGTKSLARCTRWHASTPSTTRPHSSP